MKQDVKVSIICNVYNQERYLRDALEGFVSQKTNFSFEVLVHDDASTDSSADIIREYERKYPDLFKPIYQSVNQYSQQIWITENFQVPRVRGKYVATCEGDDCWIDPLKLQKQYDFMEQNPEYSLCACSTKWHNLKTGVQEKHCCIASDMDISLEDIILGTKGTYFQFASFFVKADVFTDYPEWRIKFPIGDYPLMILAAIKGKVHMMADVMTVYRYYAENSWTVRTDNDERRAQICREMIEALQMLNADTQYSYDLWIQQRINRHKYTLAIMTHDVKALKSDELREMFYSRSLLKRTSDVLRCKYPKFYNKLVKPLSKVMKSIYDK